MSQVNRAHESKGRFGKDRVSPSRGWRRVFRQTEIAKKMVGKTEIIPKPAAAGSGNWSTASRKFYYYFLFSQVLHFHKDSIEYFAIFSSKYALNKIDR